MVDDDRAAAGVADVIPLLDRDMHHSEYRFVALDQRDVDGEFAVSLDEFLGAVEWIDQPERRPAGPLSRIDRGRRDHAAIGTADRKG